MLQKRPRDFELPNAHRAVQAIVRVDVHESLTATEARDLVAAVKKIAQYHMRRPPSKP
jgi:dTDP-4-amino-4,6-dideoxygalactose transaminase